MSAQPLKIRTRYAPSPTGRMHVGNLRTALYAYLIAKHAGGDFLLRIEDTDQERYVDGAVDIIYRTMKAAGLRHDEGPDVGGDKGPYVQSERQQAGIYAEYAGQLVEKGEAYYCFCTEERLQQLVQVIDGKEVRVYDKHCLSLSKEEVEENLKNNLPFVIRQNNPTDGETIVHDELYGEIRVDNAELDDMILMKSDGYPTYNFANVVDDHLMGITHVVRGNEYISSSPKYNRLYEAFGWDVPVYIHCPLITDENHQKLSKRSGHSSFEDLVEQGFLPEAVVNFVALLGWSPEDNQEIMPLKELEEKFDYTRINKSPSVFDLTKLKWMNGEYLKAMVPGEFFEKAAKTLEHALSPYLDTCLKEGRDTDALLHKISGMVQSRIELFDEIPALVDFLNELPAFDAELFTHKKMKSTAESSLEMLKDLLPRLEETDLYENDALYALVSVFIEEKGCKNGTVLWPLRIALTGKAMTPCGATEAMELLGKETSLNRIRERINMLENTSGS